MTVEKLDTFLISPIATVIDCMKKIDINTNKIVFMVDEKKTLLGSITDGDIRRWIIAGKNIEDPVDKIANRNPIKINLGDSTEIIKEMMLEKKIECIPVTNTDGVIIDLVFWNEIMSGDEIHIKKKKIDLPVVIMAGGFGNRLKPFTEVLPKPLIPIGDKTILERIIDKFLDYQIKDYYITINHKGRIIKNYLEDSEPDYNLHFIKEPKPLGTAGSLQFLNGKFEGNFIVTNCDIIIYSNYDEIINFHEEYDYDITLVSSMMNFQVPYGICEIDKGGRLLNIREKPEYNFLISTGMYILNTRILKYIPKDKLFHITDLMDKIKKENGKIGVFPISDKSWTDTGQWKEYKKTIEKFREE
jgi:dTDP-glucose pyrophosphorylase